MPPFSLSVPPCPAVMNNIAPCAPGLPFMGYEQFPGLHGVEQRIHGARFQAEYHIRSVFPALCFYHNAICHFQIKAVKEHGGVADICLLFCQLIPPVDACIVFMDSLDGFGYLYMDDGYIDNLYHDMIYLWTSFMPHDYHIAIPYTMAR